MHVQPPSRPRPPASRRSSSQRSNPGLHQSQEAAAASSRNDSNRHGITTHDRPYSPSLQESHHHTEHGIDLDLDLPSHLTAGLVSPRFLSTTDSDSQPLHPDWSPRLEGQTPSKTSPILDKEWVGGLDREELESLLYEAGEVIRERERDLGIAAAIGQALLQKNISLRVKHQGVMSRLSSEVDLNYDDETGTPDSDDDLPSYPQPAQHAEDSPSADPQSWSTFKHGTLPPGGDYFQQLSGEPRQQDWPQRSLTPSSSSSSSRFGFPGMNPRLSGLIPSAPQSPGGVSILSNSDWGEHVGSSPRSKKSRFGKDVSTQASETQKQLSLLSAQNEALLAQLAELQNETEEAKKQDGRNLRKLNKEIEGLQAELEAATERNVQLEQDALTNDVTSTASPKHSDPQDQKHGETSASSWKFASSHQRQNSLQGHNGQSAAGLPKSDISISEGTDAVLNRTLAEREYTAEQRNVVVRLLAKVRELERVNAVLEEAKKERESRFGQALERGVRISDEYDAVLHAHDHDAIDHTTASPARRRLPSSHFDTARHPGASSPTESPSKHKKAIGNRVQVEGRRTVRRALRQHHRATILGQDNIFTDPFDTSRTGEGTMSSSSTLESLSSVSTADSMPSLGPRRKKSALALNRPRILITPSMEDLAAKRKEQAEGWEDESNVSVETTRPPSDEWIPKGVTQTTSVDHSKQRSHSLDPMDAHWIAELAQRRPAPDLIAEHKQPAQESPFLSQDGPHGGGRLPSGRKRRKSLSANASAERLALTLDDELGTELSHRYDLPQPDYDPPMHSEELRYDLPMGRNSRPSLKSKVSFESMTSDISHLRWSVRGEAAQTNFDVAGEGDAFHDRPTMQGMLTGMDSSSHVDKALAQRCGDVHGDEDEDDVLPRGALRDLQEPRDDQYDLLEQSSRDAPVQWADDDDYGRPIKESDARKMGLLMSTGKTIRKRPSRIATGVRLISWALGGKPQESYREPERANPASKPPVAAIQSAEQVQAEVARHVQLRDKYHLAMKNRGLLTRRHAVFGSDDEDEEDEDRREEIERRSWSLSSPAKRRPLRAQVERTLQTDSHSADETRQDVVPYDASQRPPGRKHVTRQRRQRVRQQGLEAVNEITAWASLVFVLIIAFLVSASRGEMSPKRILGGRPTERERRKWSELEEEQEESRRRSEKADDRLAA